MSDHKEEEYSHDEKDESQQISTLEPRNAKLQSGEEADREIEAKEKQMREKMDAIKKGEMPVKKEEGKKSSAESLSDFIEIVIRLPKS